MLAEDHCLPDPHWAEAILRRIEEGWDAVGPALRPGNRTTCWSEGSFLLGYGEWMMPVAGGPASVVCGWNGTIRTELLRQQGAQLGEELLVGAFFVRRLREQGCRFYLESRATMRHFDPPGGAYELFLLLLVGLGFGAIRTKSWSLPVRLLYPLGMPAVAFLHWKRAYRHYWRAGRSVRPTAPAAAALLAVAWAVGEGLGAWLGVRRISPFLWRTEIKPVSRDDVARSAAQEEIAAAAAVS
jgi:hypothetical protein